MINTNPLTKWLILCSLLSCLSNHFSYSQNKSIRHGISEHANENFRIGTLPNGFTYYLKSLASDNTELRLVVNVGNNDTQPGETQLAHLVEHLAFRESQNFPQGTRKYLQKLGLSCNASTQPNATVFNITIPSERKKRLGAAINVIKDWSNDLIFTDSTILSEAKIVLEELRLGTASVDLRLMNKKFSRLIPNKLLDGYFQMNQSVDLLHFDKLQVSDFYRKWYRSNLQSLIIVGDIDLDSIEQNILNTFSSLPASNKPREYKKPELLVLNGNDQFEIVTDGEKKDIEVQLIFKKAVAEYSGADRIKLRCIAALYNSIMRNRIETHVQNKVKVERLTSVIDCDDYFSQVGVNSLTISANVGDHKKVESAFIISFTELERIRRYGFSEHEFEFAKNLILSSKPERNANYYARTLVENVQHQNSLSEISDDSLENSALQRLALKELNQTVKQWIDSKDRSFVILCNDSIVEKLPGVEVIAQWKKKAESAQITSYKAPVSKEGSLLTKKEISKLRTGTYTTQEDKLLQLWHIELENGINIYARTEFSKEYNIDSRFFMEAVSPGGYRIKGGKIPELTVLSTAIHLCGLKEIAFSDLSEITKSREIFFDRYVSSDYVGIASSGPVNQLESVLQLYHLSFSYPRVDKEAFDETKAKKIKALSNSRISFQHIMDSLEMRQLGINSITQMNIEGLSISSVRTALKEQFSNPADFTFFLSGNFELESILPMLNRYLGSLKTSTKKEVNPQVAKVHVPKNFQRISYPNEKNKTVNVELHFCGSYESNSTNSQIMQLIQKVMHKPLYERLREKEGGVYYVIENVSLNRDSYDFKINFECAPQDVKRLVLAVKEEIEKLKINPIDSDVLNAVKTVQKQVVASKLDKSMLWMNYMIDQFKNGRPFEDILNWQEIIDSISAQDIQKGIKTWLVEGGYYQVILQ